MKHIIYTSNREAILMDAMAERETLVVVQNEKVAAYYLRTCCKQRKTALRRWRKAVEAVAGRDVVETVDKWDLWTDSLDCKIYRDGDTWVVNIMVSYAAQRTECRWPLLREMVEMAYLRRLEEVRRCLTGETSAQRSNAYRRYLTDREWEKYQAGQLEQADAVRSAMRGAWVEADKARAKSLTKLAAAEHAPDLDRGGAVLSWTRTRGYGYNPHVELIATDGIFVGRAGGWGYDKRSAALSEALCQSCSAMRALYDAAEDLLSAGKQPTESGCVYGYNWSSLLPYGSGYGPIPYYEGAVGVSSTARVLEACGYTVRQHNLSGRGNMELYTIERSADHE